VPNWLEDDFAGQPERDEAITIGNRFLIAGVVSAGIGLAAWLRSTVLGRRQGKRLRPVVPLVLFAVYVLLFFVMV
jgi:hypothetical protein